MPVLAATATAETGLAALLCLAATTVAVGYVLGCWLYPFTNCHRCHSTGKRRSPFGGRSFGLCRRCDGTGRQLRTGRRVLNYLRTLHDKANH